MRDPRKEWSLKGVAKEAVEIDHPLYRRAPAISVGAGIVAGTAVAVFSDAPWWMPFLIFAVTASVLFRILRPRVRAPSIEDEI